MIKRLFAFTLAVMLLSTNFVCIASSGPSDYQTGDLEQLQVAGGQVDGYVGFSAFAAACGAYFKSVGNTWDDYKSAIDVMWDNYVTNTGAQYNAIGSYVAACVNKGLVFTRDVANVYINFIEFMRSSLGLTDNQSNIIFGTPLTQDYQLPYVAIDDNLHAVGLTDKGDTIFFRFMRDDYTTVPADVNYLYLCKGTQNGRLAIYAFTPQDYSNQYRLHVQCLSSVATGGYYSYMDGYSYTNNNVTAQNVTINAVGLTPSNISDDIPLMSDVLPPLYSAESALSMIDTATITIPANIPDTATGDDALLGVALPGIASYYDNFAGEVRDLILAGEMDTITSTIVPVVTSYDVIIDDNGDVFPSVLTISPLDIVILPDSYQNHDLKDYFPFSLPWDIYNIFAVLNAPAVTPAYSADLNFDFVKVPIALDLHQMDDLMELVRAGEFLIFVTGMLWAVWKKLG